MLTPKQLEEAADELIPIWDDLKNWITADMVERIVKRLSENDISLSSSERWRLEVFEDVGGLVDDLKAQLQSTVKISDDQLRRVFADYASRAIDNDDTALDSNSAADKRTQPKSAVNEKDEKLPTQDKNAPQSVSDGENGGLEEKYSRLAGISERMRDIMNDAYTRTSGELRNFTRTTADSVQVQFIDELDKAYLKGSSKNLTSFRCVADLVGRLYKKAAGILTYVKDFLCKLTAEDAVQMDGGRFLEVP